MSYFQGKSQNHCFTCYVFKAKKKKKPKDTHTKKTKKISLEEISIYRSAKVIIAKFFSIAKKNSEIIFF